MRVGNAVCDSNSREQQLNCTLTNQRQVMQCLHAVLQKLQEEKELAGIGQHS